MNLRIPGPTPCPPEVLLASSRQMIDHRGPEFAELLASVTGGLKRWFGTAHDLFIFPGSGTGGLEAGVANCFSPGDHVLAVSIGVFGERFASIAQAFGLKVTKYAVEFGEAAQPARVAALLDENPDIKGVLVTHNETSTGVTNDIAAISRAVAGRTLLLVDGVSSIGALPFQADAWGVDIAVTGSQKAFMSPPGVVAVSVSPRAWAASERATCPRFYWDFIKARQYLAQGQTFTTPAISILYSIQEGLALMAAEGMESVFARHRDLARYTRERLTALGFRIMSDGIHFSDVVTAAWLPAGVDGKALVSSLRRDHAIVISGGQQSLAGKIIRIGHVGWVQRPELDAVFEALQATLPKVGGRTAVAVG
jgi:aspartate aminotransferase-like enzyme